MEALPPRLDLSAAVPEPAQQHPRWLRCLPRWPAAAGRAVDVENLDALHAAAFLGQCDELSRLLEAGASANATSSDGQRRSPLHFAAMGGHERAVDALLDAGAAPLSKDRHGRTASYYCRGDKELAARLSPKGYSTPRDGRSRI